MRTIPHFISFAFIVFFGTYPQAQTPTAELRSSLFAPTLAVDHDPICKTILSGLQVVFLSNASFSENSIGTDALENIDYGECDLLP